ncbi:SAP130 family protein [Megaselia abdita]
MSESSLGGTVPGGTTSGHDKSQVTTTTTVIAGLPSTTATQIAIQKGSFPMDLAANKVKVATSIQGGTAAIIQSSNGNQGTTFRTINGPPGPLKIVVPVVNPVIKQIDAGNTGTTTTQGGVRTQITQISGRSTIARSATHAAFLPRSVAPTASTLQAQRLATPIRAQTPPMVTGSFVRGATVSRNAGWTGQVQLIRPLNNSVPRPRLIQQSISTSGIGVNVTSSSNTTGINVVSCAIGQSGLSTNQAQGNVNATIQTVTSQHGSQTFVTNLGQVLQRQQQPATLVYTQVSPNSQAQGNYTQTIGSTTGNSRLVATVGTTVGSSRQIRPLPISKAFSKVGLPASVSIRTPTLTPVISAPGGTSGAVIARNTSGNTVTSGGASLNLTGSGTTRIIQLQQPTSSITTSQLPRTNVMYQPIIMNPSGTKLNIRPSTKVQQPSLTITQLNKIVPQGTTSSTSGSLQGQQTITNLSQSAIITPSSSVGAQIINSAGTVVSASTSGGTVIPLLTSRAASLTSIKTPLTVTATLSSTAPPTGTTINKVTVTSGQQQEFNPSTSVFIHTRQASGTQGSQPTLLPPGSTIYYDTISGSGNVSTGVLSLTTTTVTPVTSSQIVSTSTPGTYTVIPGGTATVTSSRPFIQIPSTVMTSTNTVPPIRFEEKQIAIAMASMNATVTTTSTATVTQASVIPARTVVSVPVSTSAPSNTTILHSSVNSAFLRKRDADGSPVRVAKNLAPTLLSMSSAVPTNIISNVTPSVIEQKMTTVQARPATPPSRPPSTDGSTTVSANSSPGIEQLNILNEDLIPINRIPNDSHFNPINDLYSNHQNATSSISISSSNSVTVAPVASSSVAPVTTNGCSESLPPVKKLRRETNDSHKSIQSAVQESSNTETKSEPVDEVDGQNNETPPTSNKENAKPSSDFVLRNRKNCTLLTTYKNSWKPVNNHFIRHSDVKPREDRRPSVMDLANQSHIIKKIEGWKIRRISSQMEELSELEKEVFDKLKLFLDELEGQEKNSDIDRINELVKVSLFFYLNN